MVAAMQKIGSKRSNDKTHHRKRYRGRNTVALGFEEKLSCAEEDAVHAQGDPDTVSKSRSGESE